MTIATRGTTAAESTIAVAITPTIAVAIKEL